MTFNYEEWLKGAQDRLETLYQQKTAIENEISLLERGIKGFAPLVNQPTLWYGPESGITEAVRAVLKSDPSRLYSAPEIRTELLNRGVMLTQQNPMATIHQVLSRLVSKKMARIYPLEPGRNHYQWVGTRTTRRRRTNGPVKESSGNDPGRATPATIDGGDS